MRMLQVLKIVMLPGAYKMLVCTEFPRRKHCSYVRYRDINSAAYNAATAAIALPSRDPLS